MSAHLVIVISGVALRQPLPSDRAMVGCDSTCDVVLRGRGVAARHAMIVRENEEYTIEPVDGRIIVGGETIAQRRALLSGDEITIGSTTLRFERQVREPDVRIRKSAKRSPYPSARGESRRGQGPERATRIEQRFDALLQMALSVGAPTDYQAVLDRLMESVFSTLKPERAVLALSESDGRLRFEAARHATRSDPWKDLHVSSTILSRVIQSGEAFLTEDAIGADDLAAAHSIATQQIRSAMSVPFFCRGRVGGALYVDHRDAAERFDEADLDFLIMLSHLAAAAAESAQQYQAVRTENERLRSLSSSQSEIIGQSAPIARLREEIAKVATSHLPVLVQGERGTGKEVVASAIHRLSQRGPYTAVNCAAIPEALTESAFFGHEKGAFTGAERAQTGYFEQANGGTLFLDEIGDLRLPAQAAILRALQEREVRKVGGQSPVKLSVRIVAATNRDLLEMVSAGSFREDLYDRLNVLSIRVPALRERTGDVPPLAAHFATGTLRRISAKAMKRMTEYHWPGNVRELRNVVERAMVMGDGETIWPEDLPLSIREGSTPHYHLPKLETVEKDHIVRVLRHTEGNVSKAAEILGIRRITIYNKLRQYRLEPADFKNR